MSSSSEKFTEVCCKWIEDKKGIRHYIPGCMGGAVYGPEGCTCEDSKWFQIDSLLEEMKELRIKVGKLGSRVTALEKENKRLRNIIKPREV